MKIPLLKVYAGASCLAAFAFWVWAIVNTIRSGFPDAGVVTFLLVVVANSFLYRDRVAAESDDVNKEARNNGAVVTQQQPVTTAPVSNCLTTCVTASGSLVALNYLGGLALALGLIEPPPPPEGGDESPDIEMGIGFAVYCGIFAAGWTVWTILGLRWMLATTATPAAVAVTDSKAAAAGEDREEVADDTENV